MKSYFDVLLFALGVRGVDKCAGMSAYVCNIFSLNAHFTNKYVKKKARSIEK